MNWKRIFFPAIAFMLFAFPATSMADSDNTSFSDLSEENAHYDAIMELVDNGSFEGNEDGLFLPYQDIPRRHVAIVLQHELDLPVPDDLEKVLSVYDDVDEGHMYDEQIAAVTADGIFKGNNGKFNPDKDITREQMATVFYEGFELDQYEPDEEDVSQINLDNVSKDHKEGVKAFGDLGLTNQLDDFRPNENLMRGQFASFLVDVTDLVEKEEATLDEKMDTLIEQFPEGSVNGISIRSADSGESLYSHHGYYQLTPASNMKILTATAALETLGPDYTFSTEVLADGDITGGTLDGDLYLKGKGDPTLLKEDMDALAADLKDQGIEEIEGNLFADDTWFDDVRLSEDLAWDNEPFYSGAQISALTMSPNDDYDTGTVMVNVDPGSEAGDPAEVTTEPETDHVTIENEAETVAEGDADGVSVSREHGTNNIVVEGEIATDGNTSTTWSTVWNPTAYTLDVFQHSLLEEGIAINDDAAVERAETPEDADELIAKESMPLEDIFIPFMKLSNNGHAEMLTKEMGRQVHGEGTWPNGLQVTNDVLSDLGVNTDNLLLRDGSGMSAKTLIPAKELSHLLYAVQDEAWYPVLEKSFPHAGAPERMVGGTLRNRMTGDATTDNVVAKTGSLTGVYALSGYVTTKDGEDLTFSILNNNFHSGAVTDIQDEIVTELAKHEFQD